MTEKLFWKLIAKAKTRNWRDAENHQGKIMHVMQRQKAQTIVYSQLMLQHFMNLANDWRLRGAVYVVHGGCSDEEFLDFRAWLVFQGAKVYTRMSKKPEYLGRLIKPHHAYNWQGYADCITKSYERKTGQTFPSLPSTLGQKWEEADLPTLYPGLWRQFMEI